MQLDLHTWAAVEQKQKAKFLLAKDKWLLRLKFEVSFVMKQEPQILTLALHFAKLVESIKNTEDSTSGSLFTSVQICIGVYSQFGTGVRQR